MASSYHGAVILAAGASTRMGRPKQLLPIGGRTLIRRTVETVLATPAWPVFVVLGSGSAAIRPELARLPVIVLENAGWSEGLASSIRTGVTALETCSLAIAAALLVLVDQPLLSAPALDRLAAAFRETGRPAAAAEYGGHPGPPALFSRTLFPSLLGLTGAGGARPLLDRLGPDLVTVPMPELATDLDTPDDYRSLLENPLLLP